MTKQKKRRVWSREEKRLICGQARLPGVSVSQVARRYDVNANLVFTWLRDPRFALHSPSAEPDIWIGDAKIAGLAVAVHDQAAKERLVEVAGTAPPGDFDLFRAEVEEVVVIRLGSPADHLLIGTWRPGEELRVTKSG